MELDVVLYDWRLYESYYNIMYIITFNGENTTFWIKSKQADVYFTHARTTVLCRWFFSHRNLDMLTKLHYYTQSRGRWLTVRLRGTPRTKEKWKIIIIINRRKEKHTFVYAHKHNTLRNLSACFVFSTQNSIRTKPFYFAVMVRQRFINDTVSKEPENIRVST